MIKTHLDTLDSDGRALAFTSAYDDYVVPVHFSPEDMDRHATGGDAVLSESPLWQDDAGNLVGLGLLGVRGRRGWIGGFGIAKAHRGQGLARQLAEEMLQRAQRLGLHEVQLEVITINPYAIRTYERCGFRTRRDLRLFACSADAAAAAASDPGFVEREWAPLLASAPPTTPPCWQRERESLAHADGLVALAHPRDPGTYAIVSATPEIANIVALNAPDAASLASAVAAVAHCFPGAGLRLLNEPAGSPLCPWLEGLGFEERIRQHEMLVSLRR